MQNAYLCALAKGLIFKQPCITYNNNTPHFAGAHDERYL